MATYTKPMVNSHPTASLPGPDFSLSAHQVYSTTPRRSSQMVQAVSGSLWVTLTNDQEDYVLQPGDKIEILRGQTAVLEALTASSFRLQ